MLGLCLHSTSGGGGGSGDLYFYRPILQRQTSYNTYDEGWHYTNGTFDQGNTTSDIIQVLDPDNQFKIFYDDSATTGITEHLFRFVGVNGGYYDYSQASGKRWRDKDGNLSSYDDVTLTNGINYVIDRYTGIGYLLITCSSNEGKSGLDYLAQIPTETWGSYSDWWMPLYGYFNTIVDYIQYSWFYTDSDNFIFRWNNTTPPNYLYWTCTPRSSGEFFVFIGTITGGVSSVVNTQTNRAAVRMRVHNNWPLY